MKILTFCLASAVWLAVSCLTDRWLHNFGFSLLLGGLAALLIAAVIGVIQTAVELIDTARKGNHQ